MVGGGGGSSTRYRTPMMTSLPPASFSPHVHLNVFVTLTRLTYLVRKLVWIIRKLEESRAFIPPKPHRLFLVGELTEPRTAIVSHIAWTPEPVGTVWGTVYTAQASVRMGLLRGSSHHSLTHALHTRPGIPVARPGMLARSISSPGWITARPSYSAT